MHLTVTPQQSLALDAYSRLRLFPCTFADDWAEVLDERNNRTTREGLRKIRFDGTTFTAEYPYTERVPDERAINELNALADSWRAKGRDDLADKILYYYDDYEKCDVRASLTNEVKRVRKIKIVNPQFMFYRKWIGPHHEKHIPSSATPLTREMLQKTYEKIKGLTSF